MAQRDPGMRMLINDEEDEEDDGMRMRMKMRMMMTMMMMTMMMIMGMRMMMMMRRRMRMIMMMVVMMMMMLMMMMRRRRVRMKMRMNLGLPGGANWKASRFPMVLVPTYSSLKQEQLQLAQLVFVICQWGKPSLKKRQMTDVSNVVSCLQPSKTWV